MHRFPRQLPRAYTLIELLVVIVLLGITAAILLPQMTGLGLFKTSTAARQLIADITFAQSEALAAQSYRRIHFFADGSGYCLLSVTDANFNSPYDPATADYVTDPTGTVRANGDYIVSYVEDERFHAVSVSELDLDADAQSLTFDSLGGTVESPGTPAGEGRIVLTGDDAEFEITVAPVTGKVSVVQIGG